MLQTLPRPGEPGEELGKYWNPKYCRCRSLVGFNAGKSTLLSVDTAAKPAIGLCIQIPSSQTLVILSTPWNWSFGHARGHTRIYWRCTFGKGIGLRFLTSNAMPCCFWDDPQTVRISRMILEILRKRTMRFQRRISNKLRLLAITKMEVLWARNGRNLSTHDYNSKDYAPQCFIRQQLIVDWWTKDKLWSLSQWTNWSRQQNMMGFNQNINSRHPLTNYARK